MIASLKRRRYLVSIASQATSLFNDEQRRHQLADKFHWDGFWKDVWQLSSVQRAHKSESEFRRLWKKEYRF
jgi:hypothetical protein